MGSQKRLRRGTGVRAGAIVDQKQVLLRLLQNPLQEGLVTFRVKPTLDALTEQTPGERVNRPKHFVAFALATGRDFGLLAASCPRVTSRSPLGKTGLIFKQAQPCATLGSPYNRWPCLLQPRQAFGRVQMVRHKTGLLERKPHVGQQRANIMAIVEDAKLGSCPCSLRLFQQPDKLGKMPSFLHVCEGVWPWYRLFSSTSSR